MWAKQRSGSPSKAVEGLQLDFLQGAHLQIHIAHQRNVVQGNTRD